MTVKNKESRKIIGFYSFHAFGLYAVLPKFLEHLKNGDEVYLITRKIYLNIILKNFKIKKNRILFIEDYKSFFGGRITNWFSLFFIPNNFSKMYDERREIIFKGFKKKVSDHFNFLSLKKNKINTFYSSLIRIFYFFRILKKIPLNFYKLYVTTKVFNPYILTPFESKIHLIIESWDHPTKAPFLVSPLSSESWNYSLDIELKDYQGYKNIINGNALKFRYIKNFNNNYSTSILSDHQNDDINFIKNNNVAIYPMFTASDFFAFNDELIFLKKLSIILEKQSIKLYIRPYPLAPISDNLELKKISNVYVGLSNDFNYGNEVFDESHLLHKYLIIKYSKYIINLGTTFVFDAALVDSNCKIIQLKIEKEKFNDLGKYANGYHLKKYLHTSNSTTLNNIDIKHTNTDFKLYLRKWLSTKTK